MVHVFAISQRLYRPTVAAAKAHNQNKAGMIQRSVSCGN
jgi:hypothetical protein